MMNMRGHLSSETIDLLLLSALEAGEANQAKAHIDGCDTCRVRWRELNDDKQRFEQFVFARTLPKIEERLAGAEGFFSRLLTGRVRWLLPAVGVAAAAGIVAAVTFTGPGTQTEDEPYIGIKGSEPSFEVYARRAGGSPFAVKPGGALKPGDRIRFVVNPAGARFVLVASRDGKGAFSVYHPFGALESQPLDAVPRRQELAGSVELDESLGQERLVLVLSEKPVKASEVEAALKANPEAPRVPGARVISWDFVKEAR